MEVIKCPNCGSNDLKAQESSLWIFLLGFASFYAFSDQNLILGGVFALGAIWFIYSQAVNKKCRNCRYKFNIQTTDNSNNKEYLSNKYIKEKKSTEQPQNIRDTNIISDYNNENIAEKLKTLNNLLKEGLIEQEEYQKKRADILKKI